MLTIALEILLVISLVGIVLFIFAMPPILDLSKKWRIVGVAVCIVASFGLREVYHDQPTQTSKEPAGQLVGIKFHDDDYIVETTAGRWRAYQLPQWANSADLIVQTQSRGLFGRSKELCAEDRCVPINSSAL